MMWCVASVLGPLLVGFLCLCWAWPAAPSLRSQGLLKAALGVGVGLGVASCGFFGWLVGVGSVDPGFPVVETTAVIGLGALVWCALKRRQGPRRLDVPPEPVTQCRSLVILRAGFFLALAVGVAAFAARSWEHPHGGPDAWQIWNLRARYLIRSGGLWRDVFASVPAWYYLYADYPLLLPTVVARGWAYVGHETPWVPMGVAMTVTFTTVVLLRAAVAALRGDEQGELAGILLLGTPLFITHGASQYADTPFAYFLLATLVLFALHDSQPNGRGHLIMVAGLMAGCAAWTKHEGLWLLLATALARAVAVVPAHGWMRYAKQMGAFAAGLAPCLLTLLYFTCRVAPRVRADSFLHYRLTLDNLTDLSRYRDIWAAVVSHLGQCGGWIAPIGCVLLLYSLLVGVSVAPRERSGIISSLVTIGLMGVGYAGAYLNTTIGLQVHLATSINRLLLQLWPSAVFVFFLMAAPLNVKPATPRV